MSAFRSVQRDDCICLGGYHVNNVRTMGSDPVARIRREFALGMLNLAEEALVWSEFLVARPQTRRVVNNQPPLRRVAVETRPLGVGGWGPVGWGYGGG
jgi:hypothetical protein